MLAPTVIAHIAQDEQGIWAPPQSLKGHLEMVASLSGSFAGSFSSSFWGKLAGLAHDLGKSTPEWQIYIREKIGFEKEGEPERDKTLDHSSLGAVAVEQLFPIHIGRILSYIIAGHHAGLPDWEGSTASLKYRLQQGDSKYSSIPSEYIEPLIKDPLPKLPRLFNPNTLDVSFWIRMLFSCLVDGDFLDTEQYMQKEVSNLRTGFYNIEQLLKLFDSHMISLAAQATAALSVNQMRNQVLADCRTAAQLSPGLFSLTVPTGGGKTLASLGFALEHAKRFNKKRIIYVIPYTSIIEQTVDVFRNVFGDDQVIEHHSNFDSDYQSQKIRLASENWDAPIIVTTNVQFLESLYASRPGRCRKLHNIAESVVIFDEAQLLPVEFLHPILESIEQLATHYRTSLVFCTATQPSFEKSSQFPSFPGFEKGLIREIIKDVPSLFRILKRVNIELCDPNTPISWEELAARLVTYDKVLCIVSDRKSCRELYALMPPGTIHLSALMCPQHRTEIIKQIKESLKTNQPVRVISTQLVEAGVDIDFPVVFRALAGIDSIVQAAGRCNREGKLVGQLGQVILFTPARKAPPGILRKASEITEILLHEATGNFFDADLYKKYFTALYWKADSLDSHHILNLLKPDSKTMGIQFRSAAKAFTLIDDSNSETILIPYGAGKSLIERLQYIDMQNEPSARYLFRKLQRYAVSIYKNQFQALLQRGSLKEVYPKVFALQCAVEYSDSVGLLIDELPSDPTAYIG